MCTKVKITIDSHFRILGCGERREKLVTEGEEAMSWVVISIRSQISLVRPVPPVPLNLSSK